MALNAVHRRLTYINSISPRARHLYIKLTTSRRPFGANNGEY